MNEIIVVSGLPRSGTSLMMQMLQRGGIEIVSDGVREADEDNPRGYYELEAVKSLAKNASWIPEHRGKAVKIISQLLFSLPTTERYLVILMQRNLDEVIASQAKMLERLGRAGASQAEMLRKAFSTHLERLEQWLPSQKHIASIKMPFADVVSDPLISAKQVTDFLGRELPTAEMAAALDPSLYRNRTNSAGDLPS